MLKWRTLRRGLVIVLAGGLVLYLALLVYGRVRLRRAEAAFLKTFGTLDLASFEGPVPPRMQNAATWYRAGAGAIVVDNTTQTQVNALIARPLTDWSQSDREKLRTLLEDNRCALELLHRANAAPKVSYGGIHSNDLDTTLPDLRALQLAGEFLAIEARLAADRGDLGSSAIALRSFSRLTTSLENERSFLITLLVGLRCERTLLSALAESLAKPVAVSDEAALLATVREALPDTDLAALAKRAFATEGLRTFLRTFRRATDSVPETAAWDDVVSGAIAVLPETLDCGGWRFRVWTSWLKVKGLAGRKLKTWCWELLRSDLLRAEVLEQFIAEEPVLDGPASRAPEPARSVWRPVYAVAVVPSGSRARQAIDVAFANRHLIRTALALRSIGVAGRAYPDALPAELRNPDPLTGRPLAYTLHPDGSAELALQLDSDAVSQTIRSLSQTIGALRAITLPAPRRPGGQR